MYLTINSEFKPFTYDELTKPLRDYTEAYNKVEEQYATLAQQTEAWKNIATQENSPEAYAMYKKYSDELNAVVEDFSRGMTIQNRSKLTGLKSRYASEIIPIANAASKLQELIDERAKEERKDPTLKYERNIDDINIDKLIKNPFLNYGKSYSGAFIEKQTSDAASSLSKSMREDPNKWQSILGSQYYQRKIQKGYTPEEILLASIGDPKAPSELQNIVTSAIYNSGIESWDGFYDENGDITDRGKQILEDVRMYAGRGLNSAIGGIDFDIKENKSYSNPNDYNQNSGDYNGFSLLPPMNTAIPSSDLAIINVLRKAFGDEMALPVDTYLKYPELQTTDYTSLEESPYLPSFKNPIQTYEDYLKYKESNPSNNYAMGIGHMSVGPIPIKNNTRDSYEISRGVKLITDEQYEALKSLGYTSKSSLEDFNTLPEKIDKHISVNYPIALQMSDYTPEETKIMGRINPDNIENYIYEYSGTKDKGKPVSYEDLFKVSKDGTISMKNPITEIGVDPNNLNYLVMEIGGKTYSIDYSLLDPGMKTQIESIIPTILNSDEISKEEKSDVIQRLARIYQYNFNRVTPRYPKTSSKVLE